MNRNEASGLGGWGDGKCWLLPHVTFFMGCYLHFVLVCFCFPSVHIGSVKDWFQSNCPCTKTKKSTTKKTSPRNQQKAKQPSPQPTPKRKHLGPSIKKNIPSGKIVNREIVGEVSDEDANRSSAISSGSLAFSGQTWGLIAVEAMEVWETA